VRAATFQTLIGLLAVTGMRAGEAIRADVGDLDLEAGTLTVRGTKFGKTRLLPLHASVVDELHDYLALRATTALAATTALLVSVAGTRLTYDNAHRVFKKLTAQAGITPRSTACRPRMHDLRHSFAVNTLDWTPRDRRRVPSFAREAERMDHAKHRRDRTCVGRLVADAQRA